MGLADLLLRIFSPFFTHHETLISGHSLLPPPKTLASAAARSPAATTMLLHRRGLLLHLRGGLLRRRRGLSVSAEETVSPSPPPPPPPPPPRLQGEDSLFRRVAGADPRIPLAPVLEQWWLAEERPVSKPELQSLVKYLRRRCRFSQALEVRDELLILDAHPHRRI